MVKRKKLKKRLKKLKVKQAPLTALQKEQLGIERERIRRAQIFREASLGRLTAIEHLIRSLLTEMTMVDRELCKLAANISPMVNDLRRDNAELLVTNKEHLLGKNNGKTRHQAFRESV